MVEERERKKEIAPASDTVISVVLLAAPKKRARNENERNELTSETIASNLTSIL